MFRSPRQAVKIGVDCRRGSRRRRLPHGAWRCTAGRGSDGDSRRALSYDRPCAPRWSRRTERMAHAAERSVGSPLVWSVTRQAAEARRDQHLGPTARRCGPTTLPMSGWRQETVAPSEALQTAAMRSRTVRQNGAQAAGRCERERRFCSFAGGTEPSPPHGPALAVHELDSRLDEGLLPGQQRGGAPRARSSRCRHFAGMPRSDDDDAARTDGRP